MMRPTRRETGEWAVPAAVFALLLCLSGSPRTLADEYDDFGEPTTVQSLVVTEVMYNQPADLEFPLGQWFEVYNPADDPVTLAGLEIGVLGEEDKDTGQYVIVAPDAPVVPPHGFLVVGASKALALNGGVPVEYAYGESFKLPKQGGVLSVSFNGELLDAVSFGPSWGLVAPPGESLNLEPDGMDPLKNDEPYYWCQSKWAIETATAALTGTPGALGHACDSDGDGLDESEGDCQDLDPLVAPGVQEKCNGQDDNCDGDIDEGPLSGVPQWNYSGVCAAGGPLCEEGEWVYLGLEGYEEEEVTCDGMDNDCDGETDEGLTNECGTCGEIFDLCDGEDNDCDGDIDEDAAANLPDDLVCELPATGLCEQSKPQCDSAAGEWFCPDPPLGYEVEEVTCDGADNDCDGETDEGFPVGQICMAGQGMCRNEGAYACSDDGLEVVCETVGDVGMAELCGDNIDNDCDGETDEGFAVGESCSAGQGACQVTGKLFCSPDDGQAVLCSVQPLEPTDELCENGEDDDCDGETDEAACLLASAELPQGCAAGAGSSAGLTILLLLAIAFLLIPGAGLLRRA